MRRLQATYAISASRFSILNGKIDGIRRLTGKEDSMKDQLRDIMVVLMGLGLCAVLVFLGAA